jgi:hypothetical protein
MSQNPIINALGAAGYIGLIVNLFSYAQKFSDSELGLMAPMIALSLFVISAAIMGYLFLYQPALLILEGKKNEGTKLFLLTVLSFAIIIIVTVLSFFLLVHALSQPA